MLAHADETIRNVTPMRRGGRRTFYTRYRMHCGFTPYVLPRRILQRCGRTGNVRQRGDRLSRTESR